MERAAERREGTDVWFRIGLPGLAAAALLAVGALGVGWIAPASPMAADTVLSAVRGSTAGTTLAKAFVILGAGLLLRVWLSGADVARGRSIEDARRLGAMALVWSLPLLLVPVLFSRDVFSYIAASRLAPAGINPYEAGTGALPSYWRDGADSMWQDSPSPYGPFWNGLSSVVHQLTGAEPTPALLAFRLLALVGVGLLVLVLPVLADRVGADPGLATWIAVLNPMVLFHFSASAHNDALMVGLMVAGLAAAASRRPVLAVLLITLAGAIKVPALLVLPFVGLWWAGSGAPARAVAAAWAKVAAIAASTLAVLTFATGLGWGWVSNLTTPVKVDTWLSPVTALGRTAGAVTELAGGAEATSVLAVARVGGLVATAAIVSYLLLTYARRPVSSGLALAMITLVALGPVVQPWYLLWLLPLVAVLPLSRTQTRVLIGGTIGISIYSVANTAATTDNLATLPDGIAAILAVAIIAMMVLAHRNVRAEPSSVGSTERAPALATS